MGQEIVTETEYTADQIRLITSTLARGATPDELKLFLYRAKRLGLDVFKPGQLHFMKRGDGSSSIIVGIDGFRSIAAQTGVLCGIARGVVRDDNGLAIAGWAEVRRKDWTHPAREEAPMAEYNTGRGSWARMPETMIKKVAEAAALRMAFPDQLGGVYTPDEIDQAEGKGEAPAPATQAEAPASPRSGYRVPAQLDPRIAGKVLAECDLSVLAEVAQSLRERYAAAQKPIPAKGQEFIRLAEAEISARS